VFGATPTNRLDKQNELLDSARHPNHQAESYIMR
jgi:hypothetical protein